MSEPTLTSPPALEHNSTCRELSAAEFWQASRDGLLLDVRSPSEFEHGHIPGAVNLPLFNDDQRAEVGTIYRNSGKYDAVLRGLSIVGPKMADLAKTARSMAVGRKGSSFRSLLARWNA